MCEIKVFLPDEELAEQRGGAAPLPSRPPIDDLDRDHPEEDD